LKQKSPAIAGDFFCLDFGGVVLIFRWRGLTSEATGMNLDLPSVSGCGGGEGLISFGNTTVLGTAPFYIRKPKSHGGFVTNHFTH
jgi:hypothetical protein